MKKQLFLFALVGMFTFGTVINSNAQTDSETEEEEMVSDEMDEETDEAEEIVEEPAVEPVSEPSAADEDDEEAPASLHNVIKEKFIEGDWRYMTPVLLCLIIGLSISIERIISLNWATTNTQKLLANVEDALSAGGIEAAKEVTASTKGPIASIFTQGLMRASEGIEMVEKSIIAYGGVEMGRLERGLVWISLFVALAPMLGFMGTVIGMIGAFDAIEAAGDISPSIVAGGIKVALLTTVAGLIVGIILQVFYNYLVSKIDSIVNGMEDASISLVDILVKHKLSN